MTHGLFPINIVDGFLEFILGGGGTGRESGELKLWENSGGERGREVKGVCGIHILSSHQNQIVSVFSCQNHLAARRK